MNIILDGNIKYLLKGYRYMYKLSDKIQIQKQLLKNIHSCYKMDRYNDLVLFVSVKIIM